MSDIYLSSKKIPDRESLPQWVAPIPAIIERWGLRLVWPVIVINLLGTVFGFIYYLPQFSMTPSVMWPFVPDSPLATLFIAVTLLLWVTDNHSEYLAMLAFFGNIKLGLWTPWTLAVFSDAFLETTSTPMYVFLFVSHLGMVVQALVLHRIAEFRLDAILVALGWYTIDLTVDYFIPIVGETHEWVPIRPHHTLIPVAYETPMFGGASAFQLAAWGAVILTLLPLLLAAATRMYKLDNKGE